VGTVTVNENGTINYDPNGMFEALAVEESDTDSFSYTISDAFGGSDTATVTVTITGVNDAPVAQNDVGATNEDAAVDIDVLANDDDVDASDTLSVTALGDTETLGTVFVNEDGTVNYDPAEAFQWLAANQQTTDSFGYTVSDGNGGSDTATVTVTITGANDAPVAQADTPDTDEDTAIDIAVLGNDDDVDTNDVLSVTEVDATGTLGTVSINEDGTINYDPNGMFEALNDGESDTDSFTYTISDGKGGSDSATVTVTVNGVTDVPDGIVITVDNEVESVYVNGVALTPQSQDPTWTQASTYTVDLEPGDLIAFHGLDYGGAAGAIAEITVNGTTYGTSTAWKVSNTLQTDWETTSFNDEGWVFAFDFGAYSGNVSGFPNPSSARWIWTEAGVGDPNVYFRWTVPGV
jgi:VCBS repeat-containing protein